MLGGKVGPVRDLIVAAIYNRTRQIADQVVKRHGSEHDLDQKIDRLVTSKVFGYPLMLALLSLIFWLTISGANYPHNSYPICSLAFKAISPRSVSGCMYPTGCTVFWFWVCTGAWLGLSR